MRSLISGLMLLLISSQASANAHERLEWNEFKNTPQYSQFVEAIGKMRENKDPNDPASWLYWANVHETNCPHGIPYFLAWHRGYVYYFEKQLQKISGNDQLRVPYWDYYSNSEMPKEFTENPHSPLYIDRKNTNVQAALSLDPFADTVVNFQRGEVEAFEPKVESQPHNPVHNIIGGWMPTMQSPRDPIFWLHHANIDRLWAAWEAAGKGRKTPDATSPYWQGKFQYATGLDIDKNQVIDPVESLNYQYADLTLPSALPPMAPSKPPKLRTSTLNTKPISPNVLSLGGASGIALNENSITVAVPLKDTTDHKLFKSIAEPAPSDTVAAKLRLRGVQITEEGLKGGYFYKIYINLPEEPNKNNLESEHLIGTLGAFEIASLVHHQKIHAEHSGWSSDQGVNINLPLSDLNKKLLSVDPSTVEISFVRVDAENTVQGETILIPSFEIILESKE